MRNIEYYVEIRAEYLHPSRASAVVVAEKAVVEAA